MGNFNYKAFITYSHADSSAAIWLQRKLESYRIPRRLVGKKTAHGEITRRIGSMFRDREELSAGAGLSETLNKSLASSEFLIVVCSPAARRSRWVDLEIAEFKRSHDENKILCFIVDGEPFAGNDAAIEQLECFPKSLGFLEKDVDGGVVSETIAADFRKQGDGKRLAKLKIVSGLLGVGLNELVQRDAQRRQRNLMILSSASALGMLAFAMLSFVAIDARNSEELRRAEAEDLIEFMLSDLRDRLDAVGRLDVLDAVGEKAIEYYSNVELTEHSESSLGRRARAFHLLGEVDDLKGDMLSARDAFDEAYQSTGEMLARSPEDGERVYNHAQSVFWVGYLDWRLGNFDTARVAFGTYLDLADQLTTIDPENLDWMLELGHARLNLGVFELEEGSASEAIPNFMDALEVYESVASSRETNTDDQFFVAQAHAYLADSYMKDGLFENVINQRQSEMEIYNSVLVGDPENQDIIISVIVARRALGDAYLMLGNLDLATQEYSSVREMGVNLVALDPENTFNRQELTITLIDLGNAYSLNNSLEEAILVLDDAQRQLDQLLTIDDQVLEWNIVYVQLLLVNGKIEQLQQRWDSSKSMFDRVSNLLATMISENPNVNELPLLQAETQYYKAKIMEALGERNEAQVFANTAIEYFDASKLELTLPQQAMLSFAHFLVGNETRAKEIATKLEQLGFGHPEFSEITEIL